MAGYSIESSSGISRIEERLNKRVMGPRAHHDAKLSYQVDENRTEWLFLRGYDTLKYVLHVHQVGLTVPKAQELVNELKPGYKILGLELCDPPEDDNENVGVFIILQPLNDRFRDIKYSW